MDLNPDTFEDVIGAYALDACEPDEVAALDAYVAAHPEAAAEVERLREAAAALGSVGSLQPPPDLRARVLHAAADRVAPVSAREALQEETDRFLPFLEALDASDLGAVTRNGLNVRELVAHVEAIDRAFVAAADDPDARFIGTREVEAITADALPAHAGETFAETVARCRRTRSELIGLSDRVPESRRIAGYGRDDTLVVRAFETWTHHEDIERAIGRDATPPAPSVVRRMAELAAQLLPLAMTVRGLAQPERTARLVLTGPGGGEWTIACGPGEPSHAPADVVVEADVIDWCRRFADRIDPADLVVSFEGDDVLGRQLVAAADAFAGL